MATGSSAVFVIVKNQCSSVEASEAVRTAIRAAAAIAFAGVRAVWGLTPAVANLLAVLPSSQLGAESDPEQDDPRDDCETTGARADPESNLLVLGLSAHSLPPSRSINTGRGRVRAGATMRCMRSSPRLRLLRSSVFLARRPLGCPGAVRRWRAALCLHDHSPIRDVPIWGVGANDQPLQTRSAPTSQPTDHGVLAARQSRTLELAAISHMSSHRSHMTSHSRF